MALIFQTIYVNGEKPLKVKKKEKRTIKTCDASILLDQSNQNVLKPRHAKLLSSSMEAFYGFMMFFCLFFVCF